MRSYTDITELFEKFMPNVGKDILGMDAFLNELVEIPTNISNYPYCNHIDLGDNKYLIEVAVAGFAKDDIEITVENNVLTLIGAKDADEVNYIYRGIANRSFTKRFVLMPMIEATDATVENGMLTISLERIVPDALKAKTIKIT